MTGEQIPQLGRADLANLSPAEIRQARLDGKLDELLAGGDPGRTEPGEYSEGQLSVEDLVGMTPEAILKAHREGRLEEAKRRNHGYTSD